MSPDYRATSTWGTNPYPGRELLRKQWLDQGLPEVVPWTRQHAAELIDAIANAACYARPDWSQERATEWATERFAVRLAELEDHHGRVGGETSR